MPGTSGSRSSSADRRSSFPRSCLGSSRGSPVSACDDRHRLGLALALAGAAALVVVIQALAIYTIIEFAVPVAPAFVVLGTAGLVGTRCADRADAVSRRVTSA